MIGKTNRRRGGFTLIEIMIVVLIIGILLAVAIPGFVNARTSSQTKACIKNLRQIDEAKVQAAIDLNLGEGSSIGFSVIVPNYLGSQPVCPAGGTYDPKTLGQDSTCSITGHVNQNQ